MQTIVVDIINDKALILLQDLEKLQLIHLRVENQQIKSSDSVSPFKGAMKKQPIDQIDKQLAELRKAWD